MHGGGIATGMDTPRFVHVTLAQGPCLCIVPSLTDDPRRQYMCVYRTSVGRCARRMTRHVMKVAWHDLNAVCREDVCVLMLCYRRSISFVFCLYQGKCRPSQGYISTETPTEAGAGQHLQQTGQHLQQTGTKPQPNRKTGAPQGHPTQLRLAKSVDGALTG